MTDHIRSICACCHAGRYADAAETARVPSNVRRWKDHVSTVWRCPACGSINSLERVDLNRFYADYPFRQRKLDGYAKAIFAGLERKLRQHGLTGSSTVIDYGCSEGLFLDFLRQAGIQEVSGYDAYVEAFADTTALGRTYDVVTAQDLIEHAEDPNELFGRLANLVRPGGLLYIGTPCADRIDLRRYREHIHSLHQPYHICILSSEALCAMAKNHGLVLEGLEFGHVADTRLPFINWAFLRSYLARIDDTLDAGFDPPRIGLVASSPELLFKGLFGYFLRRQTEMFAYLRKPS